MSCKRIMFVLFVSCLPGLAYAMAGPEIKMSENGAEIQVKTTDGKMVHFARDLLCSYSTVIKQMFTDCDISEDAYQKLYNQKMLNQKEHKQLQELRKKLFEEFPQMLEGLWEDTSADHLEQLASAISFVKQDEITQLIDFVQNNDCSFLYQEANRLEIPVLQLACQIAFSKDALKKIPEIEQFPLELQEGIKKECNINLEEIETALFGRIRPHRNFDFNVRSLYKTRALIWDQGQLKIYDLVTDTCVPTAIKEDIEKCNDTVDWYAEGRLLAVGSGNRVWILDAQTGGCLQTIKGDAGIKKVCFSPDGTKIAIATKHTMDIRRVTNGAPVAKLHEEQKPISLLGWSVDGKQLVVVLKNIMTETTLRKMLENEAQLLIHDPARFIEINLMDYEPIGSDMEKCIILLKQINYDEAIRYQEEVKTWDIEQKNYAIAFKKDEHEIITCAHLSPDGKLLAIGSNLHFWDHFTTQKIIPTTKHIVRINDMQTGKCLRTIEIGLFFSMNILSSVEWNTDGSLIAAVQYCPKAERNYQKSIYDVQTMKHLNSYFYDEVDQGLTTWGSERKMFMHASKDNLINLSEITYTSKFRYNPTDFIGRFKNIHMAQDRTKMITTSSDSESQRELYYLSYLPELNRLSLPQLLLLDAASRSWCIQKAYTIKDKITLDVYNSLPLELQIPELFEILKQTDDEYAHHVQRSEAIKRAAERRKQQEADARLAQELADADYARNLQQKFSKGVVCD